MKHTLCAFKGWSDRYNKIRMTSRVLYVYDKDMLETNQYFADLFADFGVPVEGLCTNHPKVMRRILQDTQFRIRSVPAVLVFSPNTPGVVDKYETPDHFRILFDRLALEYGPLVNQSSENENSLDNGHAGMDADGALTGTNISNLSPRSVTFGSKQTSEDAKVAGHIAGKNRPSGRRTGPNGETEYDRTKELADETRFSEDFSDISSLVQRHNENVSNEKYAATQSFRQSSATPHTLSSAEQEVVGMDEETPDIEDMVKAINGHTVKNQSSLHGGDTGGDVGSRGSAQKQKGSAITNIAAQMKREREETEDSLPQKPMHVR